MVRIFFSVALSLSAPVFSGCGPSSTVTIQGCGATFPAPMYKRWFLEYYRLHPDVRVNYQAIGSGAGVQQFSEGLVQFGATDEALDEKKLKDIAKKLKTDVLQIPLTGGSVAICYNIPGLSSSVNLKLKRKTYIDMLLGIITKWNDPAIRASNPEVELPDLPIEFIRRADSSGTTAVFTTHLTAIDPRWAKGPGKGKTVQWPIGIGGRGNAGVSALIQQTPGSFGYIETGYAELMSLPMAALENKTGNFVLPTGSASPEALKEAKFNKVLGASVPDPSAAGAYPIASFTWVLCKKTYPNREIAVKLKEVLLYCLDTAEGRGQALSKDLGYIHLPPPAIERARAEVAKIDTK